MKVRRDNVRPAWRRSGFLAYTGSLCLAMVLGSGCGSAESAKPTETKSNTAENDLPVMKDAKANAASRKVGRGRPKVDTSSRREHQKKN